MTHWTHHLAHALALVDAEARRSAVSRNNARQRLAARLAPRRPVRVDPKVAALLAMAASIGGRE